VRGSEFRPAAHGLPDAGYQYGGKGGRGADVAAKEVGRYPQSQGMEFDVSDKGMACKRGG